MSKGITRLICLILAVICIFAFVGCNSEDDKSDDTKKSEGETKELILHHIWAAKTENAGPAIAEEIKNAEKEFGIKITEKKTQNEQYKVLMDTAKASGSLDSVGDIVHMWAGGYSKELDDANLIVYFDDYMDDIKDKIPEGMMANFKNENGNIRSLPMHYWTGVMYINKGLFDENNVKVPQTWSELVDAVKAFKDAGIKPFANGGKDQWPTALFLNGAFAGALSADTCKAALAGESFDTEEVVKAAKAFQDLAKAGAFGDDTLALTNEEAQADFFTTGKAAMRVMGSWELGNATGSDLKDNMAIIEIQPMDGAKAPKDAVGGPSDTFGVSKECKNTELAIKVVKFITEKMSARAADDGFGLPAWKSDKSYEGLTKDLVDLGLSRTSFCLAWDTVLQGESAEASKDLATKLITGDISPEEFAKQMDALDR